MNKGEGFIITKETWQATPKEQRDWIMFETVQNMVARMEVLERWNKALSFTGGIIGGIAAVLGFKIVG